MSSGEPCRFFFSPLQYIQSELKISYRPITPMLDISFKTPNVDTCNDKSNFVYLHREFEGTC